MRPQLELEWLKKLNIAFFTIRSIGPAFVVRCRQMKAHKLYKEHGEIEK